MAEAAKILQKQFDWKSGRLILTVSQGAVDDPVCLAPKGRGHRVFGPEDRQLGIAESAQTPVKFNFGLQDLIFPGVVMAQQCDICGKKPQAGNRISHAHNVTKRRWNVNLRPVHARVGAATKRMRVCTSCLRSGKVVKA